MSKKDFEDEIELFKALEEDLLDIFQDDVDKKAKNVLKAKSEKSYRDYSPKYPNASRYRRGESGSFADEINFKENIEVNGDMFTYTLENHRETDCDCAYCRSKKIYIADYIENGIAGKSRIKSKLVYEESQKQLDGEIESVIVNGLTKRDW